jgi:ATP-dependent protease ClpP protease subunit
MDDCVFSADVVRRTLRDHPDEKDIRFNIHCNGGSVSEGLAIHDLLRTSGRNIYMNIDGSCHSMTVVLLLAAPAENRTGNANLRALIHRVYAPACGYYTKDELEAIGRDVAREEEAILNIYEERTGKNRAALAAWMKSEKTRTATELLEMNFISRINSYNTNFNYAKMNRNGKPTGRQPVNKASGALGRAAEFLNRLGNLLSQGVVNFDYKDGEGNTVFSTETEEDTLAAGDTVTLADGSSEGVFTLDDGRVVTIVDNTVTEIADAAPAESADAAALNERVAALENALRESEVIISDLKNQLESNYTPGKRVVTKQAPSNARRTAEELKNEAREKLELMKKGGI